MQKNVAVQLSNITKSYVLHHEKPTFMEKVIHRSSHQLFTALDTINLTIHKGQKIGIIGANGSGKTTLLKIIAGISTPNDGQVFVKGKIVSLIDLEAGFHPDLTGEENIFLNGLLIGMKKSDIKEKYRKIVSFADIGDFIDSPFFTYSQGMKLRLAFSIAIHSNPDILILDENVVVGDESFKQKSAKKINDFFKQKKTIIIVSQWLEYLAEHCETFIWLDKGDIKMQGGVSVLKKYRQSYA